MSERELAREEGRGEGRSPPVCNAAVRRQPQRSCPDFHGVTGVRVNASESLRPGLYRDRLGGAAASGSLMEIRWDWRPSRFCVQVADVSDSPSRFCVRVASPSRFSARSMLDDGRTCVRVAAAALWRARHSRPRRAATGQMELEQLQPVWATMS